MRQVTKKGLITAAAASGVLAGVTGGYAHADSGAHGVSAHSPGVASGNTVQVPVQVPVNACGNTVNVVGLLNPATGNTCVNGGGHASGHGHGDKGHETGGKGHEGDHGSAQAEGASVGSPGVASGNTVQAPISVPVNACGNSVDVVGIGNATHGNTCVNGDHDHDHGRGHKPPTGHENPPGDHDGSHKPPAHPGGDQDGSHKPPAHHSGDQVGDRHHGKPGSDVKGEHQAPVQSASMVEAAGAKASQLAHTGAGQLGLALPASAGLLIGGALLYRRSRAAARD
ncbi:chaplin [Streptomyces sp. NPDC049577]|uniref:chaplin n=1 Tax=Streptomyces sp. NPDC049577 TaxID=3155153 RepID=UPI003428F99F